MITPVKDFTRQFLEGKTFDRVLEIGSRDVDVLGNGSIKPTFLGKYQEYIGLDLIAGKDVDVIGDAEDLRELFEKSQFDCVVCVETLEHVKDPLKIVQNMRYVLKSGGWMLITTPGLGHPEHGWPSDYYRFLENTYRDIFFAGFDDCHFLTASWEGNNPRLPDAIMGFGRKP